MPIGRVPARLIASVVLAVGLGGFWLLATLLVTIDCTFEGNCSLRENGIVAALAAATLAVLGYAMWRIWRR